ncbi:MAG: hypothetical protein U0X87_13860 [Anaerolineales bacterium]
MSNFRIASTNIYSDLFDKYQPDMVIAVSGWRMDRYITCTDQPNARSQT